MTDRLAFTPEKVKDLLRSKVLKGNDRLPPISDINLAAQNLAECLNIIRWRVQGWNGPWKAHHEGCLKIAEAFSVILEHAPSHRESLAGEIGAMEDALEKRGCKDDATCYFRIESYLVNARAQLAAWDAVIAAVNEACEVGLPLAHHMNVVSSTSETWLDIALELERLFHATLPKCSDPAAYRFIEAVVPGITGEKPSFETIRDVFKPSKSSRLVNRGTRFS
jgi:hypothetical protein